jgi:hypothetical protein
MIINKGLTGIISVLVYIFCCLIFTLGLLCGRIDGKNQIKDFQKQAISNNIARWEIIDDTGKTEFKLNSIITDSTGRIDFKFCNFCNASKLKFNTPYYFYLNSTGIVVLKLQKE